MKKSQHAFARYVKERRQRSADTIYSYDDKPVVAERSFEDSSLMLLRQQASPLIHCVRENRTKMQSG